MSSTWKSRLFLISIVLIFMLAGRFVGDRLGLCLGFIFSIPLVTVLYFLGNSLLLRTFKSDALEGQDSWGINRITSKLARELRIKNPQIRVLHNSVPTSFSFGVNKGHGYILLSSGLLRKLNRAELEAVLTYHCLAIQSGDVRLPSLVAALFGGLMLFGLIRSVDRLLSWTPFFASQEANFLESALSPAFLLIMRLILNQEPYRDLDQRTSQHLADPRPLASALWKLENYGLSTKTNLLPTLSPLCMVALPVRNKFFHFHPSTPSRIKNILGHYPI